MEEDHECYIHDEETAWHRHRTGVHERINPALFFTMAQDICKNELNLIVTFQWKLFLKELFYMNALENYLLYLRMKDWTECEMIAELVCE